MLQPPVGVFKRASCGNLPHSPLAHHHPGDRSCGRNREHTLFCLTCEQPSSPPASLKHPSSPQPQALPIPPPQDAVLRQQATKNLPRACTLTFVLVVFFSFRETVPSLFPLQSPMPPACSKNLLQHRPHRHISSTRFNGTYVPLP